jgi:glycosyltransferase involved in cell wall biosynthesis
VNILFVHQNMPGQYKELAQWLGARGQHRIVFLTQRKAPPDIPGVEPRVYAAHHRPSPQSYALSRVWEEAAGAGMGIARAAQALEQEGFRPDIVLGHVGWGELSFLRQVWPHVPIIGYFEYFYRPTGGSVGFDPEEPSSSDVAFTLQARNTVPLVNIEVVDRGVSPTFWQRDRFPESFHEKLYVCHDGIRTDLLRPDPKASLKLKRLDRPLTREDEVVTFVARNLERTRGFHIFMRALPDILRERPQARVVIVGGSETSYGAKSRHPLGLRGEMQAELGESIDYDRVHFLGRVPYDDYCTLLRVSRCHVHLTMPFVLSWSLLEAMSMGAIVVGSDVAPVREVIRHGETGLLADYFDPSAVAAQVIQVLAAPEKYAGIGAAARAHAVEHYDFLTRCLPEHLRQINALVPDAAKIDLSAV